MPWSRAAAIEQLHEHLNDRHIKERLNERREEKNKSFLVQSCILCLVCQTQHLSLSLSLGTVTDGRGGEKCTVEETGKRKHIIWYRVIIWTKSIASTTGS